jgi:hypothetical protein
MSKPSGGEGTCNCCQQPICDAPTLLCDSISASKSKCGWTEYSGHMSSPPKRYLKFNRRYTRTERNLDTQPLCSQTNANVDEDRSYELVIDPSTCQQTATGCPGFTFGEPYNGTRVVRRQVDWSDQTLDDGQVIPGCHDGVTETTTWNCGITTEDDVSDGGGGCGGHGGYACSCGGQTCTSGCSQTTVTTTTATSETINTDYTPTLICPGGGGQTASFSSHSQQLTTLSVEFTTAQLISITIAALNQYSTAFGGSANRNGTGDCSALRDLSNDESSYSIRRTKYKLHHLPTSSSYLKVWLRKRFRPEGTFGSSDVVTDLAAYIWNGSPSSGGLAFADSSHRYSDSQNQITTGVLGEVVEPDGDGTMTVEINKWSCVDGYTPDDATSTGARPFPDNHPNGWPATPNPIPVQYPHP